MGKMGTEAHEIEESVCVCARRHGVYLACIVCRIFLSIIIKFDVFAPFLMR